MQDPRRGQVFGEEIRALVGRRVPIISEVFCVGRGPPGGGGGTTRGPAMLAIAQLRPSIGHGCLALMSADIP